MKREDGNGRRNASSGSEENLKPMGVAFLKTMLLLEKPFGPDYLIRILRGEESAFWKAPDPREFETYGVLRRKSWDYLRLVLQHLVVEQLVAPRMPDFNVMEITEAGQEWLDRPRDIPVLKTSLRSSVQEIYLRRLLQDYRKNRAEEEGIKSYNVFTAYTLDRLVIEKPDCLQALADVPGMSHFRAEVYGAGILSILDEYRDSFAIHQKAKLKERVTQKKYQYVKRQLLQDRSVTEIAKLMGLTPATIYRYMGDLADAEEFNFEDWVESNVDSKKLHKGMDFFRRVKNPTLKSAFESLGIDYNTLHLCKMYVSRYSQHRTEIPIQA